MGKIRLQTAMIILQLNFNLHDKYSLWSVTRGLQAPISVCITRLPGLPCSHF